MRKSAKGAELAPIDEDINRIIAIFRAQAGPKFRVLKRQFGYISEGVQEYPAW